VLSDRVLIVCSQISYSDARTSAWQTSAVCSKSELVSVPFVLLLLTSWAEIAGEKCSRQSSGARLGFGEIQVPPMPTPHASTVPEKVGDESTASAHQVGRVPRSAETQRMSLSWSWTAVDKQRRSDGWGMLTVVIGKIVRGRQELRVPYCGVRLGAVAISDGRCDAGGSGTGTIVWQAVRGGAVGVRWYGGWCR
jgi:hypothetical protein